MKKLLPIIFSIHILSSTALADPSGFLDSHGGFFYLMEPNASDLEFGVLHESGREEKNGPGEFDLLNYYGKIELAKPLSSDEFYTLGGGYSARDYDFVPILGTTETDSETLHNFEFSLGYGRFRSEDFLLQGFATVDLNSNLEGGFDTDAVNIEGQVLAIYRFNAGAQLIGGIRYSDDFEDISAFPIVGFRLLSRDGRTHISLTAPLEAKVSYNLRPNLSLYLGAWLSGEEYDVELPNDKKFDVHAHDRRAGLGATLWINHRINVSAEIGYTLGSELIFKDDDTRQFKDGELDDTYYFSARIGFNL